MYVVFVTGRRWGKRYILSFLRLFLTYSGDENGDGEFVVREWNCQKIQMSCGPLASFGQYRPFSGDVAIVVAVRARHCWRPLRRKLSVSFALVVVGTV